MSHIPSKTRLAHLNDLSDAARQYAMSVLTDPRNSNLSPAQALAIAADAEAERAALTIDEAQQDVEEYWLARRNALTSVR